MSERTTITVTIGGEQFDIPPMRWWALEKAWPSVEKFGTTMATADYIDTSITVVAAALEMAHPELTIDEIKRRLYGDEVHPLCALTVQLLAASGFTAPGEARAPGASGSTETLTDLSPNLSSTAPQPSTNGTLLSDQ